jgi:hypothetical protein
MLDYGFLSLDSDVVDADIGLRAGAHGGDTTMFPAPGRQCDDRMVVKSANKLRQRLAGLRDGRAGLEQDDIQH